MQSYFVVSIIHRNLSLTWTTGSWSFCICIQYTWRTSVYNFFIQTLTRRTRTFVEYAQNVSWDFVGGLNANARKGYPAAVTRRTCSDPSQSCSRELSAACGMVSATNFSWTTVTVWQYSDWGRQYQSSKMLAKNKTKQKLWSGPEKGPKVRSRDLQCQDQDRPSTAAGVHACITVISILKV